MRFVSLLLLSVLLSVFVGLAAPFSAVSGGEDACCCASSPCDTAECPCGFCVPADIPGTVVFLPPDLPIHFSPRLCAPLRLTAFPDGIDYPPERLPA